MVSTIYPEQTININGDYLFGNVKMHSSNASITKINNGYMICIRYLNYILKYNGVKYIHEQNESIGINANKIIKLTNNLEIVDENKWIFPLSNKIIVNKITKGYEDVRLFNYNGIIKTIGAIENNGLIKVAIGEYDYNKNCIKNMIILNPTFTKQNVEKNWVYFKNFENKLKIIYSWYPLRICESINNLLVITRKVNMPHFFEKARGSTCGVWLNDEIWFICHRNNNLNYTHFFVVFDKYMNLLRYSNEFKLENKDIEFISGLELTNDKILLTYSVFDNSTKIGIYNFSNLDNLGWNKK